MLSIPHDSRLFRAEHHFRDPRGRDPNDAPALPPPGESLHFDKRHWAASAVTGPALEQARRIAANLAEHTVRMNLNRVHPLRARPALSTAIRRPCL